MAEAIDNRQVIKGIRQRLNSGQISYGQAKREAQPIINRINKRGAEIAVKHNKRHTGVTFAGLMR